MNIVINNKYQIIDTLGNGTFGEIFIGKNVNTYEKVAIKVQFQDEAVILRNEARMYNILNNINGVPKLKTFGKKDNCYYIVIQLLGSTLERNMSLNKIISVGIQLLEIIEKIHNCGIIHRDIKPDNILYSLNNKTKIYIIDFGLAKYYLDDQSIHMCQEKNKEIIGSVNFISLNVHEGKTPSRRDDLISIFYVLLYVIKGTLPWSNNNTIESVYLCKKTINYRDYYKDNCLPENIYKIYDYCYKVNYSMKPNYNYLIHLFKTIDVNNLKTYTNR